MWLPVSVVLLGAPLVLVADQVPRFDVTPTCRAVSDGAGQVKRDLDSCLRSEQGSRDQLEKQWPEFTAAERTRCMQTSTMGGVPSSYAELLTCLEMARDVRKLRADSPTTTGSGASGARDRR